MSIWTHVCGCIRVDSVRVMGLGDTRETIENKLGPIKHFLDFQDKRTIKLPLGSEGSLEYEVIENPDSHAMAAFTIPIWGDLRDYDSIDEIKKWFFDTCNKFEMVRSAVLNVEVEFGTEETFVYKKN